MAHLDKQSSNEVENDRVCDEMFFRRQKLRNRSIVRTATRTKKGATRTKKGRPRKYIEGMGTSLADATWADRSTYALFVVLWIAYAILNQYCVNRGIYFDATTLVWSQEVLKIVLSVGLFFVQDGGLLQLLHSAVEYRSMICWYLIPAALYALVDVITYINLRRMDPATLHLLGEMKLVLVGFVHQFFFRRRLTNLHWVALVIITFGCVVKTLDSLEDDVKGNGETGTAGDDIMVSSSQPKPTLVNYLLLFITIISGTVAGVYNEKLLKSRASVPLNLQNICLYFDGILFLTAGMLAGLSDKSSITDALSPSSFRELFTEPAVVAMAIVMSTAGLVTSRFLRTFDSVRKSIAVSLVVVSLPFLSWVFFGTALTVKMILSVLAVLGGMFLYSMQPPPGSQDILEGGYPESGNDLLVFESSSPAPEPVRGEYAHLTQLDAVDMVENGWQDEEDAVEMRSSKR
eukprot:CAMPEP_0113546358 /NCGR_PEP_ID=MMETSP0015_2-20120614/11760_1 /TAXON_ID=2838 /ORGANISM="Odontella" /LENGTH=459 /DNA_ID=CAMNT_0000446801 /DNA_START=200 /DNA_END=1580 /DNA_ORIENTATION=+ /assembly_acc=CAM_ASM_000160